MSSKANDFSRSILFLYNIFQQTLPQFSFMFSRKITDFYGLKLIYKLNFPNNNRAIFWKTYPYISLLSHLEGKNPWIVIHVIRYVTINLDLNKKTTQERF